jgi:ribonucleotide reductase alpha subunit
MRDLKTLGLWTGAAREHLLAHDGSVQALPGAPEWLKQLYKTAWEIKQKTLLQLAADRGPFVDQSQSLNVFMAEPTQGKLSAAHFFGWRSGLKTGMYYLRTKPAAAPVKFTVAADAGRAAAHEVCTRDEGCVMCSA